MAFNIDPILGAELMDVLNLSGDELSIPRNLSKFKEICDYFKTYPNAANKVLSLTSGKAADKLDHIWSWVTLNRKKEAIISELPSDQFVEDVAQEIANRKLPKEHRQRIRQDINEAKRRLEAEKEFKEKADKAVSKFDLDKVEKLVNEVDAIDEMLEIYG